LVSRPPRLTAQPNNLDEFKERFHGFIAEKFGSSTARFLKTNKTPMLRKMSNADEVDNMDDDNRKIDRDEMQEQIDDPENAILKAKNEPKMHQIFKQQSDR
jgi:hypothetical protein